MSDGTYNPYAFQLRCPPFAWDYAIRMIGVRNAITDTWVYLPMPLAAGAHLALVVAAPGRPDGIAQTRVGAGLITGDQA